MKAIKVLGTGCANCRTTTRRVEEVAKELGVTITLDKVEAIQDIMSYGILGHARRLGRRQGRALGRRAEPREDRWLVHRERGTSSGRRAGCVRLRMRRPRMTCETGSCPMRLPPPFNRGGQMRITTALAAALTAAWVGALAPSAIAQEHQHSLTATAAPSADTRQFVQFPEPMRLHTITSMRDHLLALQEIDVALSKNEFDKAAAIAEQRLGMSSLELHGAAHIAPFMPQEMQDIGTQMHRAASRFAIEAQTASVSNDVRPVLAGLGTVMQQCVACHAAYRLH